MENNFKFIIPAELEKSKSGDWKIRGLASTESMDRQGEILLQKGIDLTPIDSKRAVINYDHLAGPENLIGLLDGYQRTPQGLVVEGRLFKNHTKAKAVYEIMSSLGKSDSGRIGLSVEGKVLERDAQNPQIIKKCRINAVAVTMSPVNSDTFADIVKSMTSSDVEFNSTGTLEKTEETKPNEAIFTASQVVSIVEKALSIGGGNSVAPAERTGGDALGQESLDKKKKKLKKASGDLFKSQMLSILDKLQVLYPAHSRSEIWGALQERLETKFPELKTEKE